MQIGKKLKPIKLFSTIQGRIVVLYGLLFLIAFIFINLAVSQLTGSFLTTSRIDSQSQEVESIATHLAAATANGDAEELYTQMLSSSKQIGGRVLVLDTDGIVLMDSYAMLNGWLLQHKEIEDIRNKSRTVSYGFHEVDGEKGSLFDNGKFWAVYYTTPIVYQSRNVGILLVSVSIQDVMDMVTQTQQDFALVSILILLAMIMIGILIARWISKPIAQMTNAIQKMSHGDFSGKVKITGASEIVEMGKTFNRMSERLDNVENQRRDFISNASHELKTPLSSIKILAESLLYQENVPEEMYKEFLTDINAEIDRLNSLLTDLLTLAQADNPAMVMRMTWENLDEIIAECIHSLQPLAQEKNIKINHIWNGVSMRCDRLKMSTALINLISNGIKYTPPEGSVTVEVEEQSQFIIITVSDTGIGIPQEEQAHVFERFYRVDRARARDTGGTGLGLAIVQQVVRLHGGEIMLTSTEKSGSTFTITMPQGRPEA